MVKSLSTRTQIVGSYVYTRKAFIGANYLVGSCAGYNVVLYPVLHPWYYSMTVSEVSVLCVGYRNDIVQSESCYCVVSH